MRRDDENTLCLQVLYTPALFPKEKIRVMFQVPYYAHNINSVTSDRTSKLNCAD